MNENILRRHLKRITVAVVLISAVLLAGGSFIAGSLASIQKDTMDAQMRAEVEEYKINILRQMDADQQTLHTLASFLEFNGAIGSEGFARGLYESNNQNAFRTMAYYALDGSGVRVTMDQGIESQVSVSTLAPELQDIIQRAWKGESSVSRIKYDEELGENSFVYSVPVGTGEAVAGALVASEGIQVFADILGSTTARNSGGYIHLIGSEGKFLIRSKRQVIEEEMETVFDGGHLDQGTIDRMKETMRNQESGFFSFSYQGESYQIFLDPVGINGWYLFCVNTMQGINQPMYQIIAVTRVMFTGILLLAVFLILYGYRLLRRNNRALIQAAYHDPLTGAYNLAKFKQELESALEKPLPCGVVVMNIRQFKFINEIFGKEQADALLCHMKQVLDNSMAQGEFFCRDASDSFFLYLLEPQTIRRRLDLILEQVAGLALSDHHSYQIQLYCGAAAKDAESASPDGMMTHALFALAKAKKSRQDTIWFYDAELHKKEQLENYVESHMQKALEAEEFKLYLQPKIDLRDHSLGGAEALVRWVTDRGDFFSPDQFIPLFEENGFCAQLDLYMAECVCRLLRRWTDNGLPVIPISINQSKLLFYETGYVERLCGLTEKYQVPPSLITLEILEGLAMVNTEEVNAKIRLLRESGFKISMDDFGSGYSSLNTLGNLNIDELKLDRAFLLEASEGCNLRQRIIMEQVVKLTKRLHISTVAEGVETSEHDSLIQSLGCDFGQGYYYSRPISAEAFEERFLSKGTGGSAAK